MSGPGRPASPPLSAARTSPSPTPSRWATAEPWLLWAGLAVAFSPTLVDLVRHLAAEPWARYALVFVALFVRAVATAERRAPAADATAWIAAGLALELTAAFAGAIRWARPGLALAAFGMARRQGLASWRACALVFLAVPVPAFVVRLGAADLPLALAGAAVRVWSGLGLDVALRDGLVLGPHGAFAVSRYDGGLNLVPLLAGLGWYRGVLVRWGLPRTLAAAAGLAALAIPVQALFVGLAVLLAASGEAHVARAWLPHAPWIATAAAGIAATEWRVRAGRRPGAVR